MSSNPQSVLPPIGAPSGEAVATGGGGGRFKPIDPLRVLRTNARLLILMAFIGAVLGAGSWFALLKTMPRWTSQAQLIVEPPPRDPGSTLGGDEYATKMDVLEAQIMGEVHRIKSQNVLRDAITRPIVRENTKWFEGFDGDVQEAREKLEEDSLTVGMIHTTTLINLAVTVPFENDPPRILNSIIDVYLGSLRLDSEAESRGIRKVFLQEREQSEERIRQLNEDIRNFTEEEDIETLDEDKSVAAMELEALSEQKVALLAMLSAAQEQYKSLIGRQRSGVTEPSAEDLLYVQQLPIIQGMLSAENATIRELKIAERQYGRNHPVTKSMKLRLEETVALKEVEMDRELRELEAAKLSQSIQGVESVQGQLSTLEPKLAETLARKQDLTGRLERYRTLLDSRDRELDRQEQFDTELDRLRLGSSRPDNVRVRLQVPATIPELTFPKHPLFHVPLVTIGFIGLSIGLVILREMLDQSVRSPADIKLLSDVELLGVLPDASEDPSGADSIDRVVERAPTGLLAEQFRQVRTAILSKMDRRGYKTLVLVAAQPDCGTTSIVHNLATSLALNGRRVLMMDVNFHRPALCRTMDLSGERGLFDVLNGSARIDDVIQQPTDIPLSLLPAGDAEGAQPELLEAETFRSLLGELESRYDIVLIDTAPALLASTCQLLAKHVDAVALVVRAGGDKRGMIDRVLRQLEGQRADVLGVILNRVRSSAGGYFRKNYQAFYSYRNGGATNGHKKPEEALEAEQDDVVEALEDAVSDPD